MVELLVVIAIIALLMTILFPALSKGREAARGAVCLSNVRQLGLASANRAKDFNGELTSGRWSNDSTLSLVSPRVGGWVTDFNRGGYAKTGDILCPSSEALASDFYGEIELGPPWDMDLAQNRNASADEFFELGNNTNYAASWYTAYTQMRDVRPGADPWPGQPFRYADTLGPLTQRTLDDCPDISRVPLFGDGAVRGTSVNPILGKQLTLAASLAGVPHGPTPLRAFDTIPNPTDPPASPIVGRMVWEGFGDFHSGNSTNLAFGDGSAAKVPDLTTVVPWEKYEWKSIGWGEKAEARVFGGWLQTEGLRF